MTADSDANTESVLTAGAALSAPPLSLYVHIPWCIRKCPYCDFNSHQQKGELPEQEYINALLADLDTDLALGYADNRALHSIFIGGGTPSLFSAQAMAKLLAGINERLPFADSIEITMEANPGTFEQNKFSAFRQAGINRLSIGIQSFQSRQLNILGRVHDGNEALAAAAIARKAGFSNFNLDLMFALPEQTMAQACDDLQQAIDCAATHLSWYQLTIEPNTEFYSRPPVVPADDAIALMQDAGMNLLASAGYQRYEVSAFSQAGKQSQHNLNYWLFGDYLGIGAGAHGKITVPGANKIIRTRKTRMPAHYLDQSRTYNSASNEIQTAELPLEFMMNALRLEQGFTPSAFRTRTGLPLDTIAGSLKKLEQRNFISHTNTHIKPTALGLQFLNEMLMEFVPEE